MGFNGQQHPPEKTDERRRKVDEVDGVRPEMCSGVRISGELTIKMDVRAVDDVERQKRD